MYDDESALWITSCRPRHAGLLDHGVHLVPVLAPALAARSADVGLGHVEVLVEVLAFLLDITGSLPVPHWNYKFAKFV